jgi:hypothetical protein
MICDVLRSGEMLTFEGLILLILLAFLFGELVFVMLLLLLLIMLLWVTLLSVTVVCIMVGLKMVQHGNDIKVT